VEGKEMKAAEASSKIPTIENIVSRIDGLGNGMRDLEARVSNTVDSLVGSSPQGEPQTTKIREDSSCFCDRAHSRLKDIEDSIDSINHSLDRL
jgi:hypothetical protein